MWFRGHNCFAFSAKHTVEHNFNTILTISTVDLSCCALLVQTVYLWVFIQCMPGSTSKTKKVWFTWILTRPFLNPSRSKRSEFGYESKSRFGLTPHHWFTRLHEMMVRGEGGGGGHPVPFDLAHTVSYWANHLAKMSSLMFPGSV